MNVRSLSKSLIAAAALAVTFAATLPAPAAEAGVKVGIGVYLPPVEAVVPVEPVPVYSGGYGGGYGGGYEGGYGHYGHGGYDAYVSCRDGRRLLVRYGYRGVEVQSCRQGFYRYTAWRNGRQYLMAVDAQGDVSRLRRIY